MAISIQDGDRLVLIKRFLLREPGSMRVFAYDRFLEWTDYNRAFPGVVPLGIEDKWLVIQRGGLFRFYRSGNGILLYQVRFVNRNGGFRAIHAEVNDEDQQVQHQPDCYEAEMLDYLINRLLLGRETEFPAPPGVDESHARMLERLWMGALAIRH